MSLKESERMELICEFIKSGKQPEGYKITETKTGKYRVSKLKSEKEVLEGKRARALKSIEAIDEQLKTLSERSGQTAKPAELRSSPKLQEGKPDDKAEQDKGSARDSESLESDPTD